MQAQARVLFRHNNVGRLTTINEPGARNAPRFFLGITKQGNVARYHETLDEGMMNELERFVRQAPWSDAPNQVNMAEMIRILSQDRPIQQVYLGPAYAFPYLSDPHTQAVRITPMNVDLLQPYFPDYIEDITHGQPVFAIVQNQAAVSLCCSARISSVAAEASLRTAPDYRGRGYGLEVSTAWAAEIQKQGRIALYSTAWNNLASQAVARKLNLKPYGMDLSFS